MYMYVFILSFFLTKMMARRLFLEEGKLTDHVLSTKSGIDNIITKFSRQGNSFTLHFKGPQDTKFENLDFTLKCVMSTDYPYTPPNCYWIGEAPDHKFYMKDCNEELSLTETKNLTNTDLGIFYKWYSPAKSLIDLIGRVKYSLTSNGEKDMFNNMS